MSADAKRNALILALTVLGHEQPEHIISNAQGIADELAKIEAYVSGGGVDALYQREVVKAAGARLAEYLPAVWEFAKAGHQGGGGQ